MVFLGVFFVNLNCETEWRLFSGICIIFPAVLGLWMFWMPRSPIFLVSKGDLEGARKSLQFFRGKGRDVTDELNQIKAEHAESQKIGSVGFFEVGKSPEKNYKEALDIVRSPLSPPESTTSEYQQLAKIDKTHINDHLLG